MTRMVRSDRVMAAALLLATAAGWGIAAGCSGGGGGGKDFGDTPCYDCIATQCSALVTACQGESDCDATLSCVQGCNADSENRPSDSCADACATDNLETANGATAWANLADCYNANVDTTCLSSCS